MNFIQLHTWIVDPQNAESRIKGPMAPMMAAQEFSATQMPGMTLTGLYRLQESPYCYFDCNDEVYPDILAIQYDFNCIAVVADCGGKILPMLLLFYEDEPVFTEIHKIFKWRNRLDDKTLVSLVRQTERHHNIELLMSTYIDAANNWFDSLSYSEIGSIFIMQPDEAKQWWKCLGSTSRIIWFKHICGYGK